MMLYRFVRTIYNNSVCARTDDNGCVFYFSADDFEGLTKTPYPIPSSRGYSLQGYLYSYENPIPGRLIVFEHGMGSGHTGYMKEIEMLCRRGYRVLAYDHTGCMESGGETTGGFAQSIGDCRDVLDALRRDPAFSAITVSVIGHSWGGLSTLNVAAFHPEIAHLIALAPPISAPQLITYLFPAIFRGAVKKLIAEETAAAPELFSLDARTSLRNTRAHLLVIHSGDDAVVPVKHHFEVLREALCDRENTRFLLLTGKAHNPNYTEDAVKYKDAFFAEYKRALRKKRLTTDEQKAAFRAAYDWNRMTVQDEAVWDEIFAVLELPAPEDTQNAL